ncbi:MAG: NAD(P)H-binding protein, partial [Bacteroidota bacterium]|nr:NAD(P)H-binding protein [Bacteroidota bacterium]
MSTITILGATGQVGSKTVNNLIGKGHTLRLVARHADKLQQFAGMEGVEIHAGDSLDSDFLAHVIKGSDVVMLMMPADFQAENIGEFQDKLGKAQIEAIQKSGVKKVLFLSSVGGHTEEHTGIVAGLARQELRLKQLPNADVLILRPSY